MKDQRECGLCFDFDEWFFQDHKCAKLLLLEASCNGDDNNRTTASWNDVDELRKRFPKILLEDKSYDIGEEC